MGCIEDGSINDPRVKNSFILPSHFVYTIKFSTYVPPTFLKCKGRAVVGENCKPAPDNAFECFSPTAGPCINRLSDAYCVYMGFVIWSTPEYQKWQPWLAVTFEIVNSQVAGIFLIIANYFNFFADW